VTGYAGQLSLAQVALGGVGAFATARLVQAQGWPLILALVVGLLVSGVVGIVFGLPALRARGVQLAVVTMCVAYGLQQMVFANPQFGGNDSTGVIVGQAKLFGFAFDQQDHPARFAYVVLGAFALCALATATMRDSRVGRRLLAVRANERAAAGVGVSVTGAKLYAFTLASVIAGLAGTLLAFEHPTIYFSTTFDPFLSIIVVSYIVLGGVGYISGALFGSILGVDALGAYVGTQIFGSGFDQYLAPIGGFGLIVVMCVNRDGNASQPAELLHKLLPKRKRRETPIKHSQQPRAAGSGQLEVRGVSVRFGTVTAVDHVSFTVASGEVLGIIGPNGAGKTTILDAITGYVRISEGDIILDGNAATSWTPHKRVRAGICRSFQSLELFEDLTVEDNLRVASDDRDGLAYLTTLFNSGNTPLPGPVTNVVSEFDLGPDLDRMPTELPYGRRRLVAVARAMATAPTILLLDEPAAGLGGGERNELRAVVKRLAETWGLGVILVEHDVEFVMNVCDRVMALDFGKVIATGTPAEVRTNPLVISAYLGERPESTSTIAETTANETEVATASKVGS
jgi:sulfate-transporting ATPase